MALCFEICDVHYVPMVTAINNNVYQQYTHYIHSEWEETSISVLVGFAGVDLHPYVPAREKFCKRYIYFFLVR